MNIERIIKKNKINIIISAFTSAFIFIILSFIFLNVNNISLNNELKCENNKDSSVVDVVERVNPAVVSIVITKDVPIIEKYYENYDPFNDNFFDFFFNDRFQVPQYREKGTERREVGGGSGFFISPDGMLVTNNHVVNDEEADYTVLTNDGKSYDAEVLAKDSVLDVAILQIKGNNFPYLEFGDSDSLKLGQTVIAIGNALAEFRNSVSVGVISGLSRSITAGGPTGKSELLEGVIQTDAAINSGNSGGPLLDLSGNIIGVNVAVQINAENIGFALPSNAVKSIADSVKEYGKIIRPYIGIRYVQITESLKEKNNLSVDYGVLVSKGSNPEELAVLPGSPADKAGIVENDIILEIDGIKLDKNKSLSLLIRNKKIGDIITLKILSQGEEKEIKIELEEMEE